MGPLMPSWDIHPEASFSMKVCLSSWSPDIYEFVVGDVLYTSQTIVEVINLCCQPMKNFLVISWVLTQNPAFGEFNACPLCIHCFPVVIKGHVFVQGHSFYIRATQKTH